MSSHQIAIAKAKFAASLLRSDPTPVSRDDITHFHTLLSAVSKQCSPTNIQRCKQWVLVNAVQSTTRITALATFLVALSTSFSDTEGSTLAPSMIEPSAKRKRLYMLYLVSDLIYHTTIRNKDTSFGDNLRPFLSTLFSSAASLKGSPNHLRKIKTLLDIWEERHYYPTGDINKLRHTVEIAQGSNLAVEEEAGLGGETISSGAVRASKDVPFTMPAIHGDQNLPWYDLPAGNLMQHIIPNSTRPIDPTLVKPMRFAPGQADKDLVAAVKLFLEEVEMIYDPVACHDETESPTWDMDDVGRRVFRDDLGDVAAGDDAYYGWSTTLCEKMKTRFSRQGPKRSPRADRSRMLDRDSSRSRSSSRESSHIKKRRYSSSHSSSRSRSISRSRSRSRTSHQIRNTLAMPFGASQGDLSKPHFTMTPYHPHHQDQSPIPQSMLMKQQDQQYNEYQQPPLPPQISSASSQWQQSAQGYQPTPEGWRPQYPHPAGRNSQQQPGIHGALGNSHGHNNTYPGYRGH